MEIVNVAINKIKPDPKQPRQTHDSKKIQEMAQSIITEGIINPIEIDKNFFIITGEQRWKAAKLAGLKEIPSKIISINSEERFRRQVIENIHNSTMTAWDTAKALRQLLARFAATHAPDKFNTTKDQGISGLAREIGMDKGTIRDYLEILKVEKPLQQVIKSGEVSHTVIDEISKAPQEFQKQLQSKVVDLEFRTRDMVREVAGALKRNPEKGKDILKVDYSPYKSTSQVIEVVTKISPRYVDVVKERLKPAAEFIKIQRSLLEWLESNPPETIIHKDRFLTIMGMSVLVDKLNAWGKKANQKQLKE